MVRLHTSLGVGLLGCVLATWACDDGGPIPSQGDPIPGDGASEFVSSLSGGSSARGDVLAPSAEGAAGGAATGAADRDAADDGADASRAIVEADILKLSNDRLYALSRYNGLTIIDVSDPAHLRLIGEHRAAAEPFEMYVQDGLVYAMFNGWYSYECDEATGACTWVTESRVQALDASDPANIAVVADLEVPGYISDSRRVGDVLYLATEESGYCWGCQAQANTTVTSFQLPNGTESAPQFNQVDQLRLPSPEGQTSGGHSIAVTDQRIYVAGYEYSNTTYQYLPSSVQVIDISDAGGALQQGARFDVAGTIQSRWQMDEYDGVFRVVSQPGGWGTNQPPVMQTFRVNSSSDVQPAGSLTVQLPQANEVLQSARFDGPRGFLITAEQRDPLFTFDLSDPANPRQIGQLEMPGFVYHMEPRGNRVFALGFDQTNPEGSLNVSLFDVEDLAQPQLLSRVAFGNDWGSFAEGQNQIHKAFTILAEQNLILVPFSGGGYDEQSCEYSYGSGIQLVDFTDTTLTRRGVAPQVGNARRALLHRDHLFGIGDNAVQTFDIGNRDAPVARGQLDVARNISTVRVIGDHLMRFGSDWSTNQTILDVTPIERAGEAEPQAEVDLSALFGDDAWSCQGGSNWSGQVFTRGNFAYVPRYTHGYDANYSNYRQSLTFYVVDMTDRTAPRAVGSFAVDPVANDTYFTNITQTDGALLVGRAQGYYSYSYQGVQQQTPHYYYDVIDLANPSAPVVASRFEVPAQIASYGWGWFPAMGCTMDMGWGWYRGGNNAELTDGDIVVSQHAEPVEGSATQVKYYLDRIDVGDPYNPRMLPAVNIPGTAIHFNAETNELVTIDYREEITSTGNYEDCYGRGSVVYYDSTPVGCRLLHRSLNSLLIEGDRAVRHSQLELDGARVAQQIAVSDSRIFYTTLEHPQLSANTAPVSGGGGGGGEAATAAPTTAVLLEGLRLERGQLMQLPSQQLRRVPRDNYYYYGQLYARGERAFEIFDN
ncbi:MAG TPA: beta-propeller domain-containing protein, partial [Polyangiaceae bacterium]|nr:beta-propeller domain-containing protein [Polyangiaceae bacterium]